MTTKDIDEFLMSDNVLKSQLHSYEIVRLIEETENIEKYLTIENIKRFKLNKGDVVTLLYSVKDIDKVLTPEIVLFYNLDSNTISNLVKKSKDIERYNIGKKKLTKYSKFSIANIIKATGKIEKYLELEEFLEYLEPDEIIKQTGKISEYEKSKKSRIILPSNMKVGIEIEMVGEASKYILENYQDLGENGFESKIDLSVYKGKDEEDYEIITAEGVEIVSPILTKDFEEASNTIKRACGKLTIMRPRDK